MMLHENQKRILEYIDGCGGAVSLYYAVICRETGIKNIQTAKHHILQLEKKGFVTIDREKKLIFIPGKEDSDPIDISMDTIRITKKDIINILTSDNTIQDLLRDAIRDNVVLRIEKCEDGSINIL